MPNRTTVKKGALSRSSCSCHSGQWYEYNDTTSTTSHPVYTTAEIHGLADYYDVVISISTTTRSFQRNSNACVPMRDLVLRAEFLQLGTPILPTHQVPFGSRVQPSFQYRKENYEHVSTSSAGFSKMSQCIRCRSMKRRSFQNLSHQYIPSVSRDTGTEQELPERCQ